MKKLFVCLCALLCVVVAFAQKGISEIESGTMEDATLYDPEGNPVSICALVTVIATEDSGRRLIITQVVGPGRQVMIEAIYEREGYFHPFFDSTGALVKIEVFDAGKDYPSWFLNPQVQTMRILLICVSSLLTRTQDTASRKQKQMTNTSAVFWRS